MGAPKTSFEKDVNIKAAYLNAKVVLLRVKSLENNRYMKIDHVGAGLGENVDNGGGAAAAQPP